MCVQILVVRQRHFYLHYSNLSLVRGSAVKYFASWGCYLAFPDKMQRMPPSVFGPDAISSGGKDPVLEAPCQHAIRAVRKNEIRGMSYDLGSFERKRARTFREVPVEAYHDADPAEPCLKYMEPQVPWCEEQLLPVKQMHFSV